MRKKLPIVLILIVHIVLCSQAANACTGFGAISESGTIMGKNRDYFYVPQKFSLLNPIPQFAHWYNNPYQHNNHFYAVTSAESVSMGVNQNGLTAVEEDALSSGHPQNAQEYKMQQQRKGTADGLVLYGVLQNFNTIDEMIPYLPKIFSAAAPDFYQFADAKKILTVEVADADTPGIKQNYSYQILSAKNSYFTHTNTYLSPVFSSLNTLITNQNSLSSSNNRLNTITNLISHSSERDINNASQWFKNTYSNVSYKNNPNSCMNTSLFRTDLQNLKSIDINSPKDNVFGTVASMIVSNRGNFKDSSIYLLMLDSISTQNDGKQLIKYNEMNTTLANLFSAASPTFIEREFVRNPPVNGVCS